MRYVPSRRRHKIKETKFKGCERKKIKQAIFKDFCSSFKQNKCPARKVLPVSREKKRKLPTSSCYAFLRQKQRIFPTPFSRTNPRRIDAAGNEL